MMARHDDFCVFILTHGRADRVWTISTLERAGYTGKIFLVIDDEDAMADEYRRRYGDMVLMFSKEAVSKTFDEGDNSDDRRTITYARNACYDLARRVGCRYFIQLDDDYKNFEFTFNGNREWKYISIRKTLDQVFDAMLDFYIGAPRLTTIAFAQGGDFLGGQTGIKALRPRRKAMNSFLCDTERPLTFVGRFNEDVNTYVSEGRRGVLFLTILNVKVVQTPTQSNAGGISEAYKEYGTYAKAFYTVMYAPSCVQVGEIGDHRSPHYRIHHAINWNRAVPKILDEKWRKRP